MANNLKQRLLYNKMFDFFLINNLISTNQSGFKPGDSWIIQHLLITLGIHTSFDERYEVRAIFLDISKVFDKVWHEGLIFKLEHNGISGKLLRLAKDFLSDRKQHVVLNGQCSFWMDVQAGVPQGSTLGLKLY